MRFNILIATLLITASAWAQSDKPDAKSDNKSDKLDIKKLEQKYWSAKDEDYSVVQNRAFTKEKRFYIYSAYGVPINDPYNTGQIYNTSLGYYFTEKWGAEVTYMSAFLTNNDATDQFIREHGTVPNHNRLTDAASISGMFVPFYAKMSFLDKKIIYFDMGFSLGGGTTHYEIVNDKGNSIESSTHWHFSLFQHFFFTEHFAIRFDFKNMWTPEEKERYRVQGTNTERKLGSGTVNDTSLMIGVTYWH